MTPKELEYAFMMLGEKEPKVVKVESIQYIDTNENIIKVGIVDENDFAYNWDWDNTINYWV